MNIKIIGEHIEITESLKEYILKKISHVPLPEKMIQAEFRIGKKGKGNYEHHVKFSSNFHHKNVTIDVVDENAYLAVDNLIKKLHIVLTKHKNHNKNNSEHLIATQH